HSVSFPVHLRIGGKRPDVTATRHRRPVRNDCHEIASVRIAERGFGILGDDATRFGDPGGVGEAEVGLRGGGLGGAYFELAGSGSLVVLEGFGEGVSVDHPDRCYRHFSTPEAVVESL